jgi:hypothetical protein
MCVYGKKKKGVFTFFHCYYRLLSNCRRECAFTLPNQSNVAIFPAVIEHSDRPIGCVVLVRNRDWCLIFILSLNPLCVKATN